LELCVSYKVDHSTDEKVDWLRRNADDRYFKASTAEGLYIIKNIRFYDKPPGRTVSDMLDRRKGSGHPPKSTSPNWTGAAGK